MPGSFWSSFSSLSLCYLLSCVRLNQTRGRPASFGSMPICLACEGINRPYNPQSLGNRENRYRRHSAAIRQRRSAGVFDRCWHAQATGQEMETAKSRVRCRRDARRVRVLQTHN